MARDNDPVVAYRFQIEVGDIKGYFTEISGIGSEHQIVKHKVVIEGKEAEVKSPGRLEWGDITVKRGLTRDMSFWKWRDQIVHGDLEGARKPCTITMYDSKFSPLIVWNLVNVWPFKMGSISIKADSNDFVMEELVITHEGITREGADGYAALPLS